MTKFPHQPIESRAFALESRASHCSNLYAVLQQTRVSTVIPYFNNWISKWPTVQDLADANHDDVLAAWKGLGYYSRATRLHEGAKAMIAQSADSPCPLPSKAVDLQEFPGIGRYTAGAVSSIAFGEPEPVLDGNVIRVLSRQLGLYMDGKDKKATEVLWEEADRLIKHVSGLSDAVVSAIPGQWNQALMELGSTVCTPRPQCAECPIQATCRVYSEGQALSVKRQSSIVAPDIEDACTLCELLDTEDLATIPEEKDDGETLKSTKKRKGNVKQSNKISQYFAVGKTEPPSTTDCEDVDNAVEASDHRSSHKRKATLSDPLLAPNTNSTVTYCSLFPKKVAKKKATEEECVVCVVELRPSTGTSKWLIEQRPAKGMNYDPASYHR
jgi:A/G-specific adenine glycosylase